MRNRETATLTALSLLICVGAAALCAHAASARFDDVADSVGGLSGYTLVHPYAAGRRDRN